MALAQFVDLSSLVCHLSCHGTILAQLIQLIGVFSFLELDKPEFLRFFNSAISGSSGEAFPFDFVTQNIACHGTSAFSNDFWRGFDAYFYALAVAVPCIPIE